MQKIEDVTRTEVFFTACFWFASLEYPKEVEQFLRDKLGLGEQIFVLDSGFEVCFFRDFAKTGAIGRLAEDTKSGEKQTFDNVFLMSDRSMIIVEAKANQKFDPDQIGKLVRGAKLIENSEALDIQKVYLAGLHSSNYTPKDTTIKDLGVPPV